MPPVLPRKRLRTPSPPPPKRQKRTASSRKTKLDVFTTLDSNTKKAASAAENQAFLDTLSDDQSSLSEADSDAFEDVLQLQDMKTQKITPSRAQAADSDDELEFEDVAASEEEEEDLMIPEISEDLTVTVRGPGESEPARLTLRQGGKATITKKMRIARIQAHCMHVQFLLWHNTIRNGWSNDTDVQLILLKGLPEGLKAEVTKWKISTGLQKPERTKRGKKGSGGKNAETSARERIRDWGADAQISEHSTQGDPLIRLLKYLAAYWKKRFRVTAPSLRKLGYRSPREMRAEMDSFDDGPHDPTRHGERVADLDDFRELARKCHGSRDVGAQLFTALLRGLGIEARLVASLQPTGFGWSKNEEANPRKIPSSVTANTAATDSGSARAGAKEPVKKAFSRSNKGATSSRPISLESDSSSLSSPPPSDSEDEVQMASSTATLPNQRYDRDLLYPTYWTEVLSPFSNTFIPISTMLPPNVITNSEHMVKFEPRGAAADKAKQVMSYVVAFSADSTAKDVTVRYLRKRQWPGKTKGIRLPVEKMPVYNRNGKVARYEEYDWFKRVMRGYARPGDKRTLADDIEDEGDLVPVQSEADEKKKADPETLQGYKQSTEFVLERHLRREEALLPGAKLIKHFHIGKGDKATKEAVYKRSDVVTAKTVETWHKEGREIKIGEQALKQVPYRAVTLIRKREIEDQARDLGQKPTQGLYAEYQTQWITPDPIGPDRNIPKNSFGNIDVYVPSMVPKGAVHIPLKGTVRVCKRLGIEFAEACTGFEFGKQRAVPVLTGVVVAEENENLVIDAWEADEEMRRERENKKREENMLGLWKKFLRGMRIRDRMTKEYGDTDDEGQGEQAEQRWAGKGKGLFGIGIASQDDEMDEGGFLRDNVIEEGGFLRDDAGIDGGFLPESGDEAGLDDFEIIGGSQDPKKRKSVAHFDPDDLDSHGQLSAPISLQAMHAEGTEALNIGEQSLMSPTGGLEDTKIARNDGEAWDERHERVHRKDFDSDTSRHDALEFELKLASGPMKASGAQTTKSEKTSPKQKRRRTARSNGVSAAESSPYFGQ